MALGRWPGLRVDRTGIALLGAIVLYIGEAVSGEGVLLAIDFPTLIVLFGLMILSGQFAVCGFYDWCSARIAGSRAPPVMILALTVAVAGGLSAVLANDVIVFAMRPPLRSRRSTGSSWSSPCSRPPCCWRSSCRRCRNRRAC